MSDQASLALRLSVAPEHSTVEDNVALDLTLPELAIVTLHRPDKYNALSLASWSRLAAIFTHLASAVNLRAVVVRGGEKVFGAGADIAEFPLVRMTGEHAIAYNETIARALTAVADLPVPVIAMVRGLAVGGGCELAAACDLRVSSDRSRYGIPIGRLGVTLGYVEARAVARLIGVGNLKRLLLEGELLDAAEAHRIGLVEYVVEDTQLEARTAKLIATIVDNAPVTMRAAKLVADMCDRTLTSRDTEHLVRATVEAYQGTDLKEGVAAFIERRDPVFTQGRNL
jgi:enoyl-CoA hydratase